MAQKGIRLITEVRVDRSLEQAAARIQKRLRQATTIDGRQIEGLSRPLGKITGQADEFTKSLAASNARVIAFGASVAIINGVSDAFRGLVEQTVKVEKVLADINVVLGANERQLRQFSNGIFEVAKNTAQSFDTVAEGALEFARQGLGMEESLKRINDALILTRLTGLDVTESVEGLTAAVNTFKKEGITTGQVINKLAELDIAFAVSSEDLIKGLERAGGSAGQARVSFEELAAMIAVVQERTARGGAVIGNALRTIFARIQGEDVINSLEAIGVQVRDIDTNKMLSATQILEQLSKAFNDAGQQEQLFKALGIALDDIEKADVVQKVAGKRQRETLIALFGEMEEGSGRWADALEKVGSEAETAYQKNQQLNQTLDAILKQTGTSVQQLAARIGELSFSDNFKELVLEFNSLVENINKLFDPDQGNKLAQGFLKGFGDAITSTPVLALLGAIILKLTADMVAFGVKGLKSLLGLNNAAQQQLNLQNAILQVLLTEPAVLEELNKKGLTRVQQEQILLSVLRAQEVEYQKIRTLAKGITPTLFRAGARSGRGGISVPTGAGGFVPNAVNMEREAIRSGVGGARAGDRPVLLSNFNYGGGKRGPMVANTGEYLVNNYGGGSAIFNRNMASKYGLPSGAKPIAAGGYVPNFAVGVEDIQKMNLTNARTYAKRSGALGEAARSRVAFLSNSKNRTPIYDSRIAMIVPKQLGLNRVGETTRNGRKIRWDEVGYKEGLDSRVKNDEQIKRSVTQYALDLVSQQSKVLGLPPEPSKVSKLTNQGSIASLAGTIFETVVSSLLKGVYNEGARSNARFDFVGRPAADKLRKGLFPGLKSSAEFIEAKITTSGGSKDIKRSMADKVLSLQKGLAAGGYIPNFSALDDAITREMAAGVPINQIRINQSGKLRNAMNPSGLAVTNTRDEPTGRIPNFEQRMSADDPRNIETSTSAPRKPSKSSKEIDKAAKRTAGGFDSLTTKLFALSFGVDIIAGTFADNESKVARGFSSFLSSLTTGALIFSTFSDIAKGGQRRLIEAQGKEGKLGRFAGTKFGKQLGSASGLSLVGGPVGLGVAAVGAVFISALRAEADNLEKEIADLKSLGEATNKARTETFNRITEALREGTSDLSAADFKEFRESLRGTGRGNIVANAPAFARLAERAGISTDFDAERLAELRNKEADLDKQLGEALAKRGSDFDFGEIINFNDFKLTGEEEAEVKGLEQAFALLVAKLRAAEQGVNNFTTTVDNEFTEFGKLIDKKILSEQLKSINKVAEAQVNARNRVRQADLKGRGGLLSTNITERRRLARTGIRGDVESKRQLDRIGAISDTVAIDEFVSLKKISKDTADNFKAGVEALIQNGEEAQKFLSSLDGAEEITQEIVENFAKQIGIQKEGKQLTSNDRSALESVLSLLKDRLATIDTLSDIEKESLLRELRKTEVYSDQNAELEKQIRNTQRRVELEKSIADSAFDANQELRQARRGAAISAIEQRLSSSGFIAGGERARLEQELSVLQRQDQIKSIREGFRASSRGASSNFIDQLANSVGELTEEQTKLSKDQISEFQSLTAESKTVEEALKSLNDITKETGLTLEALFPNLSLLQKEYDEEIESKRKLRNISLRSVEALDAFQQKLFDLRQGGARDQFRAGTLLFGQELKTEEDGFAERMGQEIPRSFRDNMVQALSDANTGAKSLGDSLSDAARNFLGMMQQAFMRSAVNNFMLAFGVGDGVGMFNKGGIVRGGSGMKDDVPAYLTRGEYVIRKDAVKKYGTEYLDMVNAGGVPMMNMGGRFSAIGYGGQGEIRGLEALEKFGNVRTTSGATDVIRGGSLNLEEFSSKLTAFGQRRGSPMQQLIREQQLAALGLVDRKREFDRAEKARKKRELKQAIVGTLLSIGLNYGAGQLNSFMNSVNPSTNTYQQMANVGDQFAQDTQGFFQQSFARGGMGKGPAMLMGGEYRMSPSAVNTYGTDFFDNINNMSAPAPRYAMGGSTGSPTPAMGSSSGGDTNISITVNSDGSSTSQQQGGDADDSGASLAERIKKEVVRVIESEKRQSGALSNRGRGV
jgi:TP901 family phage tail tape measure protein